MDANHHRAYRSKRLRSVCCNSSLGSSKLLTLLIICTESATTLCRSRPYLEIVIYIILIALWKCVSTQREKAAALLRGKAPSFTSAIRHLDTYKKGFEAERESIIR